MHVIILHIEACSHEAATYKPLLCHDQLAIHISVASLQT